MSLPLRKCGLKLVFCVVVSALSVVTSLAEVWIEIFMETALTTSSIVTSLAEVSIEIRTVTPDSKGRTCHFPCGSVD